MPTACTTLTSYDALVDLLRGTKPQVAILANGDFPSSSLPLSVLREIPHIVLCDGAAKHCDKLDPNRLECIIGDGDSLLPERQEERTLPFIHIPEQDTNDLTKAVTYCLSRGWDRIVLLGATGQREDHTIANIFLLPHYHKQGATVCMVTDHGLFLPFCGEYTLRLPVGLQLSVFSPSKQPMTASGVMYPFENRTFDNLWEATLNEVTAPEVYLYSHGIGLLYLCGEIKRRLP